MAGVPLDDAMLGFRSPLEQLAPHEQFTISAVHRPRSPRWAATTPSAQRLTDAALAIGLDQAFGFFVPGGRTASTAAPCCRLGRPADGVAELAGAIEDYVAEWRDSR